MKIILDIDGPDEDPNSEAASDEEPEVLLARATNHERALRAARIAYRAETARLRGLYARGLLRPAVSSQERAYMRAEFFARGGRVTRLDPATARGAHTSPFWDVDKSALVPGVREIDLTLTADGYYEVVTDEDDNE